MDTQEISETERQRDIAATTEYFKILRAGKSHKAGVNAAIAIKNKDRRPEGQINS